MDHYFQAHPKEKKDIAIALNVDERTFSSWLSLGRNPRNPALIFPVLVRTVGGGSQRSQLTPLILEEFPEIAPALNEDDLSLSPVIPPLFYEKILDAYVTTSVLSAPAAVLSFVMNQLVRHLDASKQGVAAFVVKCVSPPPRQKVQALTVIRGFQSPFWKDAPLVWTSAFLGRESFLGMVLSTGQPEILSDISMSPLLSIYPCPVSEGSLAVYPIVKQGSLAGCVLLISIQPGFFSEIRRGLLDKYCKLVALAFRDHEFYQVHEIDLEVFSPSEVQLNYLKQFNNQVITYMSVHPEAERTEAELAVLKKASLYGEA